MRVIPRGKVLFDTSAYIRFIREGSYRWLENDEKLFQRTILTAVVAAELYAGSRSPEEKLRLDRLCLAHQALGSLSSPQLRSWLQAGQMIGRYARLYGRVQAADHFRDGLIALEAARHQATLATENVRDFLRWRKLLRSAGLKLEILDLRNK